MSVVIQLPALHSEGRFANRLIHYLVGRYLAEQNGGSVQVPHWIGELMFDLRDPYYTVERQPINGQALLDKLHGVVALPPFFACPHAVVDPVFTRAFVQRVLPWRTSWLTTAPSSRVALHVRRGDYLTDPAFPNIPLATLRRALAQCGFPERDTMFVREDQPGPAYGAPWPFEFLGDFQRLMRADNVLVYPRSSFSQMAALLGTGNIYMPKWEGTTHLCYERHDDAKPAIFPVRNNQL